MAAYIFLLYLITPVTWADEDLDNYAPLSFAGALATSSVMAGKQALDRNAELKELTEQLRQIQLNGINFSDLDIDLMKKAKPGTMEVLILKLRKKNLLKEQAHFGRLSAGFLGLSAGAIALDLKRRYGAIIVESGTFMQKNETEPVSNIPHDIQPLDSAN